MTPGSMVHSPGSHGGVHGRDRYGRCLLGRTAIGVAARRTREPAADRATKSRPEFARHQVVEDRIGRRAEVVENACTRGRLDDRI